MTLPWWSGVPAAQATLSCGDATHRLIWRDGSLIAADHADPEGERALAALGGEPLRCIAMLDTWRRYAEDLDVLLLGSRGPTDLIAPPDERRPPRLSGRGRRPPAELSSQDHLALLLSLGGGLGRRLDATVAAHWRGHLLSPDAETARFDARLQAALYGRVLATLCGWLGCSELDLSLELAPELSAPRLRLGADGRITARLAFGWLIEVWARGLEVVWGRFCLSASSADGKTWELQTIGPELGDPTTVTVTLPA